MSNETPDLEISRVTIVRRMHADGCDTFEVTADTASLLESLGLLELAKMDLMAPSLFDRAGE